MKTLSVYLLVATGCFAFTLSAVAALQNCWHVATVAWIIGGVAYFKLRSLAK